MCWARRVLLPSVSAAGLVVGSFADDVGVAGMAGGLFDQVGEGPAAGRCGVGVFAGPGSVRSFQEAIWSLAAALVAR